MADHYRDEFIPNLVRGLRRAGIIHSAATTERWEEFHSNCRNMYDAHYKIAFLISIIGATILLNINRIDLYLNQGSKNVIYGMLCMAIGAALLSTGAAIFVCARQLEAEIKRHNTKRFPPNDIFA
jgi:hypothetical protein